MCKRCLQLYVRLISLLWCCSCRSLHSYSVPIQALNYTFSYTRRPISRNNSEKGALKFRNFITSMYPRKMHTKEYLSWTFSLRSEIWRAWHCYNFVIRVLSFQWVNTALQAFSVSNIFNIKISLLSLKNQICSLIRVAQI